MLNQQMARFAIENSSTQIYWVDADGRILEANDQVLTARGCEKDELLTLGLRDIAPHIGAKRWRDILERLRAEQRFREAGAQRRKDGSEYPVEFEFSLYQGGGEDLVCVCARDISHRRQLETACRLNEQRLATVSRAGSDLIYEWDVATDALEWIGDIDAFLGYAPGEISKNLKSWTDLIHPEDVETLRHATRLHRSSDKPILYEYRIRHRDGSYRYWKDHGLPLLDAQGRPRKWLGICTDVTETTLAREKLEFQLAFEQTATRVSSRILKAAQGEFDAAIEHSLRELGQLFQVDRSYVFRFSPDLRSMIYTHEWCAPGITPQKPRIGQHSTKDFPSFMERLRDGPVHISDVDGMPEDAAGERHEFQAQGIKSLICLPLLGDGNALLGFMGFDSVRTRHHWPDHQIAMLQVIADLLSSAIRNKQVEEALLHSSQRYRSAIETTRDGFWVMDSNGRLLEVNEAYCRMSGYTRDELLAMRVTDLESGETAEQTARRVSAIVHRGHDLFETDHRRKDGEIWPVEVSVSLQEGENDRFFVFLRDIHERKLTEELTRLRQQLAELVYQGDMDRLMQTALNTAERITHSQIGFFHFVKEDQENLSLQTWSTRTLKEACFAEGKGLHYPVSEAGVWVDCIHQRAPVIHNDYAALPHKKGMPEGHATLVRELTVPVFRDDAIVAVIGVGNKTLDYTQKDAATLHLIADTAFDFVERKRAEQHIQYMAYYDTLTGTPNRSLLSDRLNQAMAQNRRSNKLLAVCYLDLDGFKPINDLYGHDTGDKLLVILAQRLKETLREGDTLARLGGDEFAALLTNLSSPQESEAIVHRLLKAIEIPFKVKQHTIHISGSIGVTLYPTDDVSGDQLLRHADQAMYQAKASGKSGFRLYDMVEDQKLRTHRETLAEIRHALSNDEFTLYYQPKIELSSGRVVGVEALARWRHAEHGLLTPAAFLPYLTGTPEEIELGQWVIKTALDQHMAWMALGLPLPISVNISPKHIQETGFSDFFAAILKNYPPGTAGYLELEIVETAAIGDIMHVAEIMNACTELGLRFSLDDFGTGYSSLTYFHRLPIDVLKIDQNFVRDMMDDVRDLDIVEGVLRLAQALKRPVVAEGVESVELGLLLLKLGCQYAQGYGIARPMPADQLPRWLSEWKRDNVWNRLSQQSLPAGDDLELNVAVFSHELWLNRAIRYIKSEPGATPPPLSDRQCMFSRWYGGLGQARYGNRPVFAFIPPKHTRVHEMVDTLVTMVENGDTATALTLIDELKVLSDEFIGLLKKLNEH